MYEVSNAFFTALEGFIFFLAFLSLSDRREFLLKHIQKIIFFVAIYTFYALCLTYIIPTGLQTLPIGLLTVVILNYIFNGKFHKSVIKFIITCIFYSLIEMFIVVFSVIIIKIPMDFLISDGKSVFICSIISKSIELTSVIVLYKSNYKIKFLIDRDFRRSRFTPILILISSFLAILMGLNVYISFFPDKLPLFNVFSLIVYLVLIVSVIMMFREFSRLELLEFASYLEKENIQQLIDFNEMVSKERHEYKNHLNTIYGLCTLNKPDMSEKIKLYINNYANVSGTKKLAINSGNDYVDAILNVKYNNALQKGIEFSIDFDACLTYARIDEDVAVTIISNIVENAFESVTMGKMDKKLVSVKTYILKNKYFISISNNGPMITEADKKKIFNAGFSTKDNSTKKRGFGLSIVLAAIERSGGDITINSNEQVTEFLITVSVNSNVQQDFAKMA